MMTKKMVGELRRYIDSSEPAKAVCQWLEPMTKDYPESPIRVIARESGIDYYDCVEVMKKFGEIGLGRFWNGRKGKESRFEWWIQRGHIGQAALGQLDELEYRDAEEEDEEDEEAVDRRKILKLHRQLIGLALQIPTEKVSISLEV